MSRLRGEAGPFGDDAGRGGFQRGGAQGTGLREQSQPLVSKLPGSLSAPPGTRPARTRSPLLLASGHEAFLQRSLRGGTARPSRVLAAGSKGEDTLTELITRAPHGEGMSLGTPSPSSPVLTLLRPPGTRRGHAPQRGISKAAGLGMPPAAGWALWGARPGDPGLRGRPRCCVRWRVQARVLHILRGRGREGRWAGGEAQAAGA